MPVAAMETDHKHETAYDAHPTAPPRKYHKKVIEFRQFVRKNICPRCRESIPGLTGPLLAKDLHSDTSKGRGVGRGTE